MSADSNHDELGVVLDLRYGETVIGKKLSICPEGAIEPFEFTTGSWCGDAWDSVGISWWIDRHPKFGGGRMMVGATMTRKDVRALRELLEWAEANWSSDPKWGTRKIKATGAQP